jgi:nucleolar protein 56
VRLCCAHSSTTTDRRRHHCCCALQHAQFGEELRQQVEERLDFYDTGKTPRKNLDVMRGVISEVGTGRKRKAGDDEEGSGDGKKLKEGKKSKKDKEGKKSKKDKKCVT